MVFKCLGAIGQSLLSSHVRKDEDHCEGNDLGNQKHAQQFGLQIIRPHERTKKLKQIDVKQIQIIKLNLCL